VIVPWSPQTAIVLALVVPALGVVGIDLASRWPNLREAVTLTASIALLLVVLSLVPHVLAGEHPSVTLVQMLPGVPLAFRVEPLGMIFAVVASLLWPINSLYSIGYMRGNAEHAQTRFYICFAIALMATMGVAFSANLLTMFVFYEVLTLSTYPLVAHHEDEEARRGARVYLGILLSTSIGLLLPAILWVWNTAGTVEFRAGGILDGHMSGPTVGILLAMMMFGIGKAALMPVHRWLPAAMVAPTPVSALLHAVAVVKTGVFAVTKVIVYVFGLDFLRSQPGTGWLLYVAGFTIVAASVVALRQDHLKRRLAYSTVSQLSYIVISAALFTPAGVIGAALQIVAHAFGKITLFFAAGSIHTAAHKDYISDMDGVGRRMPWTMGAFAIGSLSMIGVPLTAGFVSKWYILGGAVGADQGFMLLVMVASTLLNAGYFLPIVYRAFFRSPGAQAIHGEAPAPVVCALVATAGLTLAMFLFPALPLALAQSIAGGG